MSEAAQRRAQCVAAIRWAIGEIARDGREPDLWERVLLSYAISALFRGAYGLGLVDAQKALVPPAERSANPNLPADPFFDRCDLALLNAALRDAEAEPVRETAHLGPIVFDPPARR